MRLDQFADRWHVGLKQKRREHRSLWRTTDALDSCTVDDGMAAGSHELLPVGKAEAQLSGGYAVSVKLGLEAVDKDVVVDGVERRRDVEAGQISYIRDDGGRVYTVLITCSSGDTVECVSRYDCSGAKLVLPISVL